MPNCDLHRPVGGVCGLVAAFALARQADSPHPVIEAISGTVGGWMGGALPDLIEPATSPRHRKFFHSWLMALGGGSLSIAALMAWQATCRRKAAEAQWEGQAMAWCASAGFLAGVITGYLSHLATDAGTPQGLPVFA